MMNIKNNFTDGKTVSSDEYFKMLMEADKIPLKRSKPKSGMVKNIRNIMEKLTEWEFNTDELPDDYDNLVGNFGIMNHLLNDMIVIVSLNGEDKLPEILLKYRDEDGNKLFNKDDCDRYIGRNFDETKEFIDGILNVHKVMTKLSEKKNKPIVGGNVIYTPRRNKIVVDFNSLNKLSMDILKGGKDCDCPCDCDEEDDTAPLPSTGSDPFSTDYMVKIMWGGSETTESETTNTLDTKIDKLDSKIGSLNSFIEDGEKKMKRLVNAEGNLSEDEKSQFDWVHWKFYKLWTMERLHPVLTLPFDMVDPLLKSIGIFVKKFLTPILSKFTTPAITFLWQTLGTLISASSMVPFVGVATGAVAAVHSQLTTPVMMLAKEGAELVQFIIDGMVDFASMIFNLQRKNWSLAFDSFISAFKANGLYETFLGHIRALTILLKRIGNILDQVSQYPNIADDILDNLNSSPVVMNTLNSIDYVALENNLKRILQIGVGLSKRLIKVTDGILFTLGLPDTLIDEPKKGGGIDTKLVEEYITLAFSPLDITDKVGTTEKINRFNQLYSIFQ